MALTLIQLFPPTVLTTGAATLFTCLSPSTTPIGPGTTVLRNGRIRFSNTSAGAVTVTAYAVPVGGSNGAGNCFLNAVSVAPNSYLDSDIPMLKSGDFVQALCNTATSLTALAVDGVYFS